MSFSICIIGCGRLSTAVHGPSLARYARSHDDVELRSCCDIDPDRAAAYCERFGFRKWYTDFERMLDVERPDAVCLVVPVHLTVDLGVRILERSFPLLTEKPPGLDRDECLRLIAAAEKSGAPNQVAFNRRYMPIVSALKKRLAEFAPGEIQTILYDFFRIGRCDADFSTTAIHGIDTVKFLAGADYRHVRFYYREYPELGPTVADIRLEAEFTSGTAARITFCPVTGAVLERATVNLYDQTFFAYLPMHGGFDHSGRFIHLVRGEVRMDVSGPELAGSDEPFVLGGFYGENRAFFDDLRAGRRPRGDIRSGLQSVEIADCIRRRVPEYRNDAAGLDR